MLYDRDARGGELLHFYTAQVGGRVFFELLERRGGYGGYGAAELTRSHGRAARGRITRQLGGENHGRGRRRTRTRDHPRTLRPRGRRGARASSAAVAEASCSGPSVILVGVGVASGEYILFPYIASQAGLVFLWAAVVGVAVQFFINMEIERYTLATGETAIGSFQRLWRPWGAILAFARRAGHDVARVGDGRRDRADLRRRRRRPERDRDRDAAGDRRAADRVAGRLPDGRAARVHQGRRDPGVRRDRRLRRDQGDRLPATRARSPPRFGTFPKEISWRSSSVRWPPRAPAARTTWCRATGSATRASAWAATSRASSRRSPATRRPRPAALPATASRPTRPT